MKRPFMVWIGFISICCSKVAKEGKSCPRLLVLQRVAQNAKSCSKVAEHNLFMPIPDATQISAMVGDHSRQMKTQIFIVGGVGDGFRSIPIPQIAELQSPRHASFNFWRTFHFRLNSSGITERIVVIIRYIWDGRQKVKAAIVWDFPDI